MLFKSPFKFRKANNATALAKIETEFVGEMREKVEEERCISATDSAWEEPIIERIGESPLSREKCIL